MSLISTSTTVSLIVVAAAVALASFAYTQGTRAAYDRGWSARDLTARQDAQKIQNQINGDRLAGQVDAKVRDEKLSNQLQAQNVTAVTRRASLNAHLAAQENIPYQETCDVRTIPESTPAGSVRPLLAQSVLDDVTVGLLDDARANRQPGGPRRHTPTPGDATGEPLAPAAPITGGQLADNDLEVVRLYHELAARHRELTDWVDAQCKAAP